MQGLIEMVNAVAARHSARQIITAVRNGEEVRLHRCTECWPRASNWDNGFIPVTLPIIHARACSQLKGWTNGTT
jgi:hypothetical protein